LDSRFAAPELHGPVEGLLALGVTHAPQALDELLAGHVALPDLLAALLVHVARRLAQEVLPLDLDVRHREPLERARRVVRHRVERLAVAAEPLRLRRAEELELALPRALRERE